MAPTPATVEKATSEAPAENPVTGLARIFIEGALLLLACAITLLTFVLFVPDLSDYHLASKMKHDRLASLPSPKIVITGGSNLAYGIDSELIERETGMPVVNMGMDGYLGVRFLLREIEADLKPSDLVIIAPEHDSYSIPIQGEPGNQFAVVKSNYAAWSYLDDGQRRALLHLLPSIGHGKALRLLENAVWSAQHLLLGVENEWQIAERVERFSGFNPQGDLTTHLDMKLSMPPYAGIDLSKVDPAPVVKIFQDFNRRMKAKGVRVMFSYPPIPEAYHAENKALFERIHAELTADPEVNAPSPPSAFVLPEEWFFDTVYHVVRPGREARTRRLVGDILRSYPPAPSATAER